MKKQLTGKHIGNGYLKVGFYMFNFRLYLHYICNRCFSRPGQTKCDYFWKKLLTNKRRRVTIKKISSGKPKSKRSNRRGKTLKRAADGGSAAGVCAANGLTRAR